MKLCDFIVADAIVPELQSDNRDDIIRELVDALVYTGRIKTDVSDEIVTQLIDRENQGSTGIGKGIAVPHIKHASASEIVGTIGLSKKGIDFSSLDHAPVYSVLLLVSPPNNPDRHLEAMESVFTHLQRDMFRKFLRQAETREAIVDLLEEADASTGQDGL
jgi:mannitol/fructose-specific phosphotransferase system IIA component (Ntr-type)